MPDMVSNNTVCASQGSSCACKAGNTILFGMPNGRGSGVLNMAQPYTSIPALTDSTLCDAAAFKDTNTDGEKKCFCESELTGTAAERASRNRTCGGTVVADVFKTNPTEAGHDTTKSCVQKADVVIVLDESGSVKEDNFWKMKHSVQKIVRDFRGNDPTGDLRMGFVKFSSSALVETELTSDINKVVADIEETGFAAGTTWTREAYDEAYKLLVEGGRGGDYRKVIIFITDGKT